MINETIKQLLKGEDLTFCNAKETFDEIFSGLSTQIQSSSFITALETKKPTLEEKAAGIISSRDSVKKIKLFIQNENTIENISLDENNDYLDFVLMNDLICSACNLNSLRYCFKSHIYNNRSFNILSKMGVNFKESSFELAQEIEQINLGYFYLNKNEPFYKYTYDLKKNLEFYNILSLFERMLNPYESQNLFMGIKKFDLVEDYAALALKLNIKNAIIVSGYDNLPFVSIENETNVAEAWKNKIFSYKISPELLEFKRASLSEIKCENDEHCAQIFLDVIENKIDGAIFDSIVINAGFSLYISKTAPSLIDGIEMARSAVKNKKLREKFESIKNFYNRI